MNSISLSDRNIILNLLGENCKLLSTAQTQVWKWSTSLKPIGQSIENHTGVLCFVRDCNKKGLYFRLYCLQRKKLLWESRVYTNKYYKEKKPFLHTFPYEDYMIGFNFADEREADYMKNALYKHIERLKENKEDFECFEKKKVVDHFFKQKGVLDGEFEEDGTRKFIYARIHKNIMRAAGESERSDNFSVPARQQVLSSVMSATPVDTEAESYGSISTQNANDPELESFVTCPEYKDDPDITFAVCPKYEPIIVTDPRPNPFNPVTAVPRTTLNTVVKTKVIAGHMRKFGKEDISPPTNFKKISTVGYNHETDEFIYSFDNIESLITTTSISIVHLKSILDFINKTGLDDFKEQVDAQMLANKTTGVL